MAGRKALLVLPHLFLQLLPCLCHCLKELLVQRLLLLQMECLDPLLISFLPPP